MFPDARIIWIHRDPTRALPSVASMTMTYLLMGSRGLDPVRVARYWSERLANAVDRALDFDSRMQRRDWCCHVHYDALLKDPVGTVREIRAHFGAELDLLHERRIRAFMRDRVQDLYGRHVYRMGDFGMTTAAIDQRFATYNARYRVTFEGR